jgi:hypothetical protein
MHAKTRRHTQSSNLSPLQQTTTDPKQPIIQDIRNLLQITFAPTENKSPKYQTWCWRLSVCTFLRKYAFSRPIWHTSASRQQHVREFDHFSEILASQKISSSPTEQKTPRNPRSIACISPNSPWPQSLSFFFRDRRIDRYFLLTKFDVDAEKRRSACSTHIHSTQACDPRITWTHRWMLAAILAMRVPSFHMFDHLFVDAEPACNPLLWEQTSWTRNITSTREDALALLVPSKYFG